MTPRIATRRIYDPKTTSERDDSIAVEEPLEIRVAGDVVSTTMRTPGDDHELALGFLFAEGIVSSVDDVGSIVHCGRLGEEGFGNVIDVAPGPGVALAFERVDATRRGTITTSACGVCGRRTVEDLMSGMRPVSGGAVLSVPAVVAAVASLREVQTIFARTGATHAASAHAASGERLAAREDVGRHNAVDKVIGALLRERRLGEGAREGEPPALLVVSGRASFEMVQKAARAAIPVLASVSAPTTLAIDLANEANVTLIGFVRGDSLNLYTHPERLRP